MLNAQPDLFATLIPPCGDCPNLGAAIDSGIRYCHGDMTWRWAADRVEGCPYRGREVPRWKPADISRADAIRDLLESPRHDIDAKGRAWLKAELKREMRA